MISSCTINSMHFLCYRTHGSTRQKFDVLYDDLNKGMVAVEAASEKGSHNAQCFDATILAMSGRKALPSYIAPKRAELARLNFSSASLRVSTTALVMKHPECTR